MRIKKIAAGKNGQLNAFIWSNKSALFCDSLMALKRIGNNIDVILNNDDRASIEIHKKEDLRLANLMIEKKID